MHRDDVPPEIDAIVLRLLAKSVTVRFQTAAEVIEAIERAARTIGAPISATALSSLMRAP